MHAFKRFSLSAVLVLILLNGRFAKAALLLEPYLGYEGGSADTTFGANSGALSNASNSLNFAGLTLGGRLGFSIPVFFIAADYSLVSGSIKMPASTDNMTSSSLGAVVGVHVPLIRAWVGYSFMHDLTDKASGGDHVFGGSAIKAGLGFTGLPFVSLNLEYIMSTYTKFKSSTVDEDISAQSTYSAANAKAVLFTVSLPLEF